MIAMTTRVRLLDGTVFEASEGTQFIVRAAHTRKEADALERHMGMGTDATVLAVRPDWSFPDESWIAADPTFWKKGPRQ